MSGARIADILQIASEIWDVHPRDLAGNDRFHFCVRPRQAVYLVAREQGLSFPQIGRRLGRDHSTVLNGIGVCHKHMRADPNYAGKVEALRQRVAECKPWGLVA